MVGARCSARPNRAGAAGLLGDDLWTGGATALGSSSLEPRDVVLAHPLLHVFLGSARLESRRDALVEALSDALPEVRVHGIQAGLHVTIQLRDGDRGRLIRDEAARRGVALTALSDYYHDRTGDSSLLLLGYGRCSEAAIRAGRARAGGGGAGGAGDRSRHRSARSDGMTLLVGVRPPAPPGRPTACLTSPRSSAGRFACCS